MRQHLKNLALGFYYILMGMALYIIGSQAGGFFQIFLAIAVAPVIFHGLNQCLAGWKREKH